MELRLKSLVLCVAFFAADAGAESREDSLAFLRRLKTDNQAHLTEIDKKLQQLFTPNTDTESKMPSTLTFVEREVEIAGEQRQEFVLRQTFLDRLIFHVDTHFKGGDFRQFLQKQLAEMARIEVTNSSSQPSIWKFLTYLSHAIRDLPESNENLMAYVEGYMKFASVAKPIRPEEYTKTRNYSNGQTSVAAAPVEREKVGELVEDRLQELEQAPKGETRLPAPDPN